jgi:hypothetical protein
MGRSKKTEAPAQEAAEPVIVKLTDDTKKALLDLGKKIGKGKQEVIDSLLPEFKAAFKDAMAQGWLQNLEDEDEKQGAIMDVINSRYLLGKSKARMGFRVFITRNWGKQISRKKQEPYGKAAGFILGDKNELVGFCQITGKKSDTGRVAAMDEGQAYSFKAGILNTDGATKALIREDEEDEPEALDLEGFKITSKTILDALPAYDIGQVLDIVKPGKDAICAMKVTVGDVAKFREKPGAFLKCMDASLMADDELRESMGGFTVAVPEDSIFGPGARLVLVVRAYQKIKKGTGFGNIPAEPDGFPQADALYVLATLPVPYSLVKSPRKGPEQVEDDLEKEVKADAKKEEKEDDDGTADEETDGMD